MKSATFSHLLLFCLIGILAALMSGCGTQPSEVFTEINSGLDNGDAAAPQNVVEATVLPSPPPAAAEDEYAEIREPLAGDSAAAGAPLPEATGGATSDDIAGPAVERPVGPEAGFRAGEIDDNDDFAAYLNYLQTYYGNDVRQADIGERYIIRVINDDQRPILDARVTIFDGATPVFRGRTTAEGRTIFFPRVLGLSENTASLRVTAEYDQAVAETTLVRGTTETIEIGLRGVTIDPTLRLDLLFLLDTTGSMGDELGRLQTTIDDIAQRIDAFTPRPDIRYGMVAYKDNDDAYVTRSFDFTRDLESFRNELRALSAQGGGDTPEAVDEALYEAVVRADWSEEPAVRLVFLVADAGPHMSNQAQFTYLDSTREAVARGLKIYPIAASNTDPQAEYVFRQLAQQTLGGFVFLTYQPDQSGGAPGDSTTLDAGDQPYTVERLDDLIVGIIERELAAAVGAR
jgi:Mg-chelatase subunit ChlD